MRTKRNYHWRVKNGLLEGPPALWYDAVMAKCLVTGGAGFIGSNLALELESLGHAVSILDNFHSADPKNLAGFQGELHTGDASKEIQVEGPFEIIFHQAAITDPRYPHDEEILRQNVVGFENIIRLADRCRAKLVYASTAGLYGNGPVPMQEDQPKEILSAYGKSKLQMDELTFSMASKRHIVGLRYFNVFGPREAHKGRPASMVYHLYQQMKKGQRPRIFEFGEQIRDFIYVKDIVAANLRAVEAPSGVYNVGTGVGTTFNQLITRLNEVMGTHWVPEYFPMPYEAATYQNNTQADTKRATAQMGFKAKWDLKTAIRDYIEWLER